MQALLFAVAARQGSYFEYSEGKMKYITEETSKLIKESKLQIKSLGEQKYESPFSFSICQEERNIGFFEDDDRVIAIIDTKTLNGDFKKISDLPAFEKAGPREKLYFKPGSTYSAIVTCGGLCPGLNAVIRSLVMMSWYRYGNHKIYGIKFGYNGLSSKNKVDPLELTPDLVRDIGLHGGTFLGSSRGAPPVEEMVDRLEELKIDVLYVIGGDGTQKGALRIIEEIEKRGLAISVVGIPKTIDNDIEVIDRSFGFESAFSKACEAIYSGSIEAKGAPNCISIVKVMGRDSGFIAARSTVATNLVNFCLVPEIEFDIEGENGLLEHMEQRIRTRGNCVIVVAEGAGQKFFEGESGLDASGNKILQDIGLYLKDKIKHYFDSKKIETTIKYIDPSYIIRSCPPTPSDMYFCSQLAQMAVHAAMAGKTGMVVGLVHNKYVHIPMELATLQRKRIHPHSQLWHSVIEATGQPNFMKSSCELK